MSNEKKYDVFIAYHGTFSEDGSYEAAKQIAKVLKDSGIKPYLYDHSSVSSAWKPAKEELHKCRCMIVVVNDNVPRDGKVIAREVNDELHELYQELTLYRDLVNYKYREQGSIKFVYSGKSKNEAECSKFCNFLYSGLSENASKNLKLFSDTEDTEIKDHIKNELIEWVKDLVAKPMPISESKDTQNDEMEYDNPNSSDFKNDIVNDLLKGNCAVVLGPLVNYNYDDFARKFSGKDFFSTYLKLYDKGEMQKSELEAEVEKFSTFDYSPIVYTLARLPFNAYLTTVEHTKIETAISDSLRKYALIKNPEDVYKLDLQNKQIPIFEFKRSERYKDDCVRPNESILAILKSVLANKKIIYIGYDDIYNGYSSVLAEIKNLLGDHYRPTNNIVISYDQKIPPLSVYKYRQESFYRLNYDAWEFLSVLSSEKKLKKFFRHSEERYRGIFDEVDKSFFGYLSANASAHTPTEALDIVFDHLWVDLESDVSDKVAYDAISSAIRNIEALSSEGLQNFHGTRYDSIFRKWVNRASPLSEGESAPDGSKVFKTKDGLTYYTLFPQYFEVKEKIRQFRSERAAAVDGLKEQGRFYWENKNLKKGILLFSRSKRVAQFLAGASDSFKKNTKLFICECRPNSPTPFLDAKNMFRFLVQEGARFKEINMIPDVTAFSLLERKEVDVLILGANEVTIGKETRLPLQFVNTSGSRSLVETAIRKGVEVNVVADKDKILFETNFAQGIGETYYDFRHRIENVIHEIVDDDYNYISWAESRKINSLSYAHDFCAFHKGMKLILPTEIREIKKEPTWEILQNYEADYGSADCEDENNSEKGRKYIN